MSRTPKPTALKKLTGNPGHRPLNANEPRPLIGEPDMPDFLSEVAQDEWKRMVPILLNMRVLTIADGSALAGYCSAYAQFRWAEEYIARNGAMVEEPILNRQQEVVGAKLKKNPAVAMKNESAKIMRQFLGDFGLSPAMRSKVQTMAPGNDGKDELDKLLEDDDPVSTKTLTQ